MPTFIKGNKKQSFDEFTQQGQQKDMPASSAAYGSNRNLRNGRVASLTTRGVAEITIQELELEEQMTHGTEVTDRDEVPLILIDQFSSNNSDHLELSRVAEDINIRRVTQQFMPVTYSS